MATLLLSSIETAALSRRLGELTGDERALKVEFLLHLDEYDRRRAYLEAGFGSLWQYLTRVLHYREGAAYRRIKAMNALRRVPALADALRDGRLCLTTLAILEPLLTVENAADLVARAAFASKADVEQLVASLQPRPAPRDGLRRHPAREVASPALQLATASLDPGAVTDATSPVAQPEAVAPAHPAVERRPTLTAVAADSWSLHVTIDGERTAAADGRGPAAGVEAGRGPLRVDRARRPPLREPLAARVHHVEAAALGGPATIANLELRCKAHNGLDAERTFGRAHMEQFRRKSRTGESTSPGGNPGPERASTDAAVSP